MPRVKRGKIHSKSRQSLRKQVKGYMWGRKNTIRAASTATSKAGVHAYDGRKNKKRDYRKLWQIRISAGLATHGISYSVFIGQLKKAHVELDRKILADLVLNHSKIFDAIVKEVASAKETPKKEVPEKKEKPEKKEPVEKKEPAEKKAAPKKTTKK